ncbi:AAA family ATPase [Streptomyces sp. NPDC101166]|uniref:AAA family ATPase n=1 Tax=Streptomyces sp. NPDC101166 TaxID=3366120 RepID=UPI00380988EF
MTARVLHGPDPRDGRPYDMTEDLRLAVEVALATERPLLLSGDPGSGKSSLAPFLARERHLRYYEHVVTSRTQATDLLWTFDSVRRLADAQAHRMHGNDGGYLQPGVLWWSLAPESARTRGGLLKPPDRLDPLERFYRQERARGAVVLIDEIDKADPDMPNGLLVPLGSQEFTIAETGATVCREDGVDPHLVVITTNGERELPPAFLRRCITFELPPPTEDSLVRIAELHLAHENVAMGDETMELVMLLAEELAKAREEKNVSRDRLPSTAEFLDALRACRTMGLRPGHPKWHLLRNLTLLKPRQSGG